MIQWRFWVVFCFFTFAPLFIAIGKYFYGDPILFQRSGGFIVAGAVISLALIRHKGAEFEKNYLEQAEIGVAMHSAHQNLTQATVASKFVFWLEVGLIVLGTIISSYGDLLISR